MLDKLTDNYNKNPNSGISKLFKIITDEIKEINTMLLDVKEYRDIDRAKGATLNKIGRNVHQLRIDENDEYFRQLIKTKIIANLSKGDVNTINEVANVLIGDSFVGVKETWNDPSANNEVAGLSILVRNHANFIPFKAIDRVIAGGIGVKWLLEFKPENNIYIGSALIAGEQTTVYPLQPKDIEFKTKIKIGMGMANVIDKTEIYPRKEVV